MITRVGKYLLIEACPERHDAFHAGNPGVSKKATAKGTSYEMGVKCSCNGLEESPLHQLPGAYRVTRKHGKYLRMTSACQVTLWQDVRKKALALGSTGQRYDFFVILTHPEAVAKEQGSFNQTISLLLFQVSCSCQHVLRALISIRSRKIISIQHCCSKLQIQVQDLEGTPQKRLKAALLVVWKIGTGSPFSVELMQ